MCGVGTPGVAASAAPVAGQAAPAVAGPQQNGGATSQASVGLEDGIGGAVGIVAVSLGIGGMALGVYRRRRGLVNQAEANQRR